MLGSLQIGLGAVGFVPTDLGTLIALYDGPDIVHSGASLTGWNDSSGNANHLAGGGGFVADNGTGHPAATFNGTAGQGLVGPVATRMRSWFAVISDINCANAYAYLCAAGPVYGAMNSVHNQLAIYTNATLPISGQPISAGRHSVAVVMRAGNDVDFYLDGAKANQTTGSSFYIDLKPSMACDNGGGQQGIVHFEHMSIFTAALSDPDVAKMLGYIGRVYGA